MTWNNVYITDISGKKFFDTIASPLSTMSEIKNLTKHMDNAKKYPLSYKFLNTDTMQLMLNGEPYIKTSTGVFLQSDDELLKELMA
jgi:hypothetical protein